MRERYIKIVQDYVETFLRKHEMYEEDTGEYYDYEWVADDIGSVLEVSSYYISFDDIRYDIDKAIPKDTYFDYYNYVLEYEKEINYHSYIKGVR